MKLLPHTQGGPVDEILHDYGCRDRALRRAPAHFEQLLGRLTHEATQQVTHGELEAMVQAAGSELLRRMIQGYFDQRGAEEPIHARVVGEDGIVRIHRGEDGKQNLEPRFGEAVITRRGYGRRGVKRVFPLDAVLNLPPDQYSHGRREVLVEQVIRGSFDAAVGQLEGSGGGQMAKRQAEEVAVHLSQDFDTFYAQARARPQMARDKGKLLVISADGKGIVMHPKGLCEATRRAMEREKHKQHTRLRGCPD